MYEIVARILREYRSNTMEYKDSNALALCFEDVDKMWYHRPLTLLEFEQEINGLVLLVLISKLVGKSKQNQTVLQVDR